MIRAVMRQLSPHMYTLLDGLAEASVKVVKDVVFLEIQASNQPRTVPDLEVLKLVGYMLRMKMRGNPSVMHRALIVVKDIQCALHLVHSYDAMEINSKPVMHERVGSRRAVRMRVAAYHGGHTAYPPVPADTLMQFNAPKQPNPIHCLIQIGKLGEGYDQPRISVVGICTNMCSPNKAWERLF